MRVYFDENFSPHIIAGMRCFQDGRKGEGISVASVVEEFQRGAADEEWIPQVASRHGVAVTQDTNIHRTRAQWELCQQNKIGIFFFKPSKKDGWNYWKIVQLTVHMWPELMRKARETERPFGYVLDATKAKLLKL